MIGTLPLDVVYKARIPQFYYNDGSNVHVEYYTIKEVKKAIVTILRKQVNMQPGWLPYWKKAPMPIYNFVIDKKTEDCGSVKCL